MAEDDLAEWAAAHGYFAYELATGLLAGVVITGLLSKEAATKLIDDARIYLSKELPVRAQYIEEIAAKATAHVEVVSAQARRAMDGDD